MDMQEHKITVCLISPFCNCHCEYFDPFPSNYMVYMLHTWASGIDYIKKHHGILALQGTKAYHIQCVIHGNMIHSLSKRTSPLVHH